MVFEVEFVIQSHQIIHEPDKIKFSWGVKALPWLIRTDKEHMVQAEGFGIDELDNKIKEIEK